MTKLMKAMVMLSVAAVAVSCGVFVMEKNNAQPRALAHPSAWPEDASIAQANRNRETVVAFVQPHSGSTLETLANVDLLMKKHPNALAYVMFERAANAEEGSEVDQHWLTATQIPGAVVLPDPGGALQARFGARPGEMMVYDASGALEQAELKVASR
ncbi:MAG: hypothetical protein QM723_18285 [Myxococcaceae bacterium]